MGLIILMMYFVASSRESRPGSFSASHLYCPFMATEHMTGLAQPARAWRRDVSAVETDAIQIDLIDK